MSSINYDLRKIKAIVFDVDGVLSATVIPMSDDGDPLRTVNIKDGYAINQACKRGVILGIITGGKTEAVRRRYENLGIPAENIYLASSVKIEDFKDFCLRNKIDEKDVLYVGDDIPDMEIMSRCGLPCCPKDAVPEVKEIAKYISHADGGYGCGRDVIEQYMKANGLWMKDNKAFGW